MHTCIDQIYSIHVFPLGARLVFEQNIRLLEGWSYTATMLTQLGIKLYSLESYLIN